MTTSHLLSTSLLLGLLTLVGCGGGQGEGQPPTTPTTVASAPATPASGAASAPPADTSYGYTFDGDELGKPATGSAADGGAAAAAGRIPPEVIQSAVRSRFDKIEACYQQGLKTSANLSGTMVVKFQIERDGKVSQAEIKKSDISDAAMIRCVTDVFGALTISAPTTGIVKVVYPLSFAPPEAPLKQQIVGTWQFDFSGERRAAVEADARKAAGKNEKKFQKLVKDAEDEASKSHFEITADTITSKIGDKVLFRIKYSVASEGKGTMTLKVVGKPEGAQKVVKEGDEVTIGGDKGMMSLKDKDTLIVVDPKKGPLSFKRKG